MDRNVALKQQAMALSTWRQEELVLSQAPALEQHWNQLG